MGSLFSPKMPDLPAPVVYKAPDPKPPAPMPDPESPAVLEAARQDAARRLARAGRQSTILTQSQSRSVGDNRPTGNYDSYAGSKAG